MIQNNTKVSCKERRELIINNYSKELGIKEITEKCRLIIPDVSKCLVSRTLKKYNLPIAEKRGKVTEMKNIKNPFELGDPNNNYWLGYFMADGGMSRQKSNLQMFSVDKEFLYTFNEHVGIKCNEYHKAAKNSNSKPLMVLYFGNQNVWNYLYSIGITPNKSKTMSPKFELDWNIVRGLFDGDGSISKGEFKITTASLDMVDKLSKFFIKNKFQTRIVQKGNAYDVYIRYTNGSGNKKESMESKKRLYSLLYPENCKYYLNRKKLSFSALLQ